MINFLRQAIRLIRIRQNAAFMALMHRQIDDLRQRYSGDKRLEPAGYKVYSQGPASEGVAAPPVEVFSRSRRKSLRRWPNRRMGSSRSGFLPCRPTQDAFRRTW